MCTFLRRRLSPICQPRQKYGADGGTVDAVRKLRRHELGEVLGLWQTPLTVVLLSLAGQSEGEAKCDYSPHPLGRGGVKHSTMFAVLEARSTA